MNIININCPCVNCEKRGCGIYHDKCKEYQVYKKNRCKLNKKIKEHSSNNYGASK